MASSIYEFMKQKLDSLLNCGRCQESRELRVLPCQHKLCWSCLRQLQRTNSLSCPFCSTKLTKQVDFYPVCMVCKHFQKNRDSMLNFIESTLDLMCQSTIDCDGSPVHLCKQCMTILCQNCSVGPCQGEWLRHKMVFLDDYADEAKQRLNSWTIKRRETVTDLTQKRDVIIDSIRDCGEQLTISQVEQLDELATKTADTLQERAADLTQVNNRISEEETALSFLESLISGLDGTVLIGIFRELQTFEYSQKILVSPYAALHMGIECYDVTFSSKGHMVVAREGGVDVIDISDSDSPVVIHTMSMTGYAFSLVRYKANIVVATRPDTKKIRTEVLTLDGDYEEVRRWTVNIAACDFTIADDKIIFSNQESLNLKMYTMMGNALPDVTWKGVSAGISGMSSASMAIADNKYNKVYRKVVREGRNEILWTADVIKPFAMCVDTDEYIWIRSNRNDCITIISPQGNVLQEIIAEGFTRLGEWSGILVHDNYIYVCHEDGVGRFELIYGAD